jgi:hypothetical protein
MRAKEILAMPSNAKNSVISSVKVSIPSQLSHKKFVDIL